MLFTKNIRNILKYHLVTAEPPSTVKTIDWMHQTGPRILLSVIHMLYTVFRKKHPLCFVYNFWSN